MKSQVICDALNTVNPTPAQRARMRAALEAQLPAEKPHRRGAHQQKASSQRWWTIIPAAAALFAVVLLGIFVLGRTDKTPPSMSNVPTEPLTLESLQSSSILILPTTRLSTYSSPIFSYAGPILRQ